MARRSSAVLEAQPSLFDDNPAPAPASKPSQKPAAKSLRNHVLGLPRPWPRWMPCAMVCLVCKRPEGAGICEHGCAVVCGRPHPLRKDRIAPVEVCILTLTVPARLVGRHAAVACPHCGNTHWHQPAPGRAYRVGQCRQPYIAHLAERSTP